MSGNFCDEDDYIDYDPCPCDDCAERDWCDGWEAQFCCTLCRWRNEDPDCEDCDPWDI